MKTVNDLLKERNVTNYEIITEFHFSGIKSIEGIEKLVNIRKMFCSYNKITELDLRNFKDLEYLDCSENKNLKSINISGLDKLKILMIDNNKSLDIENLYYQIKNNESVEFIQMGIIYRRNDFLSNF